MALMRGMPIARLVIFSLSCLFSIIVLGANGAYISSSMAAERSFFGISGPADSFSAFNVAVAVFSFILVPPMIIVDFLRHGAFTSMIITELCVFGFLSIFWLVSAAWTSSVSTGCSAFNNIGSLCTDVQISTAFGWLNWIMLTAYFVTLLVLSILSNNRGLPVWKASVRTAADAQPAKSMAPPVSAAPAGGYAAMSPPLAQVTPQMQAYAPGAMYPPNAASVPSGYGYTGAAQV